MFQRLLILLSVFAATTVANAEENRWSVYAGGSLNHLCLSTYGDTHYGWGGGALVGAGYDIRFNSHWSLTPQLELGYTDNGGRRTGVWAGNDDWRGYWSASIPVLANYRLTLSDKVGLRFGAGVFYTQAFAVKCYDETGTKKVTYHTRDGYRGFEDRLNLGVVGEIAAEVGPHLSYGVRVQYPVKKYNIMERQLTLSATVRYSF